MALPACLSQELCPTVMLMWGGFRMALGSTAAQEGVPCRHGGCAEVWSPPSNLAPLHAGCLAIMDLACGRPLLISGGWNGQPAIPGEAHGSLALPVISAWESPSFQTKPKEQLALSGKRCLTSKCRIPTPACAGPCVMHGFPHSHSKPQIQARALWGHMPDQATGHLHCLGQTRSGGT